MSIVYIPTKPMNQLQTNICEAAEQYFIDRGYRDIGGNGYYQYIMPVPQDHKDYQHEYDEYIIEIWHHSEVTKTIWNGMLKKSRKATLKSQEVLRASQLQTVLQEIVKPLPF
jgi:uncharacterized lipoprotein YajG